MSVPPEGERPGGEEPFEGLPPEETEAGDGATGELPDLEPEFTKALDEAASQPPPPPPPPPPAPDPDPPAEASADGEGDGEAPGDTVEFTPEQVSEAQQTPEDGDAGEQGDGDGAGEGDGRRTVVIGSGANAPTEVSPVPPQPPPPPVPPAPQAAAPAEGATAEQQGTPAQPASPPPPPQVPPTGPANVFQKPPPEGDWEPAPRRKRLWLRFLIATVLIIGSMAGATAASALYFLNGVAGDLGGIPQIQRQLLPPQQGEPENILIFGSDKRASETGTKGLSDTTILLRLDPDNKSIALMSIPRDLKTYIPGVGTTKFNAAYSYGGPKLALRVVKNITGLPINHVVNVDFLGFQRAVNAIGCVYVEVDRRYYHSNLGLPASLQYAEINIQPGYQKLCGKDALTYVRYRHTDTDLVRSARQQDFLREARQQVPATDLFFNKRQQLLDIFTTYTTSDISSGETLLQVLKLFVASRNAPIQEIHFPALLHPSYVTASKSAVKSAVNKFLGIEASGGPRGSLPASSGKTGIVPEEKKRAKAKKGQKHKAPPTPSIQNDGLVDASEGSRNVAAEASAKTLRSFPVFYPRRLPAGTIFSQQPRVYHLHDSDGVSRGAYVEVLQLPEGDYFDVQGVHGWTNPPILNSPSESRTMNGRDYDIYLDGDRVRLIAWHQGNNTYWVANSLLQTLTNQQMLGMARSIGKLPGERNPPHKKKKGKK